MPGIDKLFSSVIIASTIVSAEAMLNVVPFLHHIYYLRTCPVYIVGVGGNGRTSYINWLMMGWPQRKFLVSR